MPVAPPGEVPKRGGWRAIGDALSVFGWFCFGACVVLFALWYITGLSASGVSGRIGVVTNPEAPQDQWRYEPAVDIEVFVAWQGDLVSGLMQTRSYCARTRLVRTDAEGRFSAGGWWAAPGLPPPRIGPGYASPLVPGMVAQYFPYPSVPPEGYTTILGPPPADSAIALALTDYVDPVRFAVNSGCPPPQKE